MVRNCDSIFFKKKSKYFTMLQIHDPNKNCPYLLQRNWA
jgi:hypothetical protein